MADEKEKKNSGPKLSKIFLKAAGIALSMTFGFYVMGALDFTLFHEMAEGAAFMERVTPVATELLRGDIPILGFSIADTFTWLASLLPVPALADPVANDTAISSAMDSMGAGW